MKEKSGFRSLCSFISILFSPTSLVFFFPYLSERGFVQSSAWLFCAHPGICISELLVSHKGKVVLGYLSNEAPAEAMWRIAGTFWLWVLCQGLYLSAFTRDVWIFADVIVLVSLPECFRSGYWKVWHPLFTLFTICFMVGCIGGCYLKAEIYLLLKFHYLSTFFQLILTLGLFITNSKNNVWVVSVYIFCCT